jgi:signal peptidase II
VPGGTRKTIAAYLVPLILIVDQLSKYIVSRRIPPGQSIPVVKNIFHLTYVTNQGAAFGIFKNQIYFFIAAALIAIVVILVNLRRRRIPRREIALSLILAGAAGNLIDRIRIGAVIDFLDFRIWPVFNIADTAITIGAILLAYTILRKPETSNQ